MTENMVSETICTIKMKSQNHQNSDLDARPLKVAYLFMHDLTESVNVMTICIIIKKCRNRSDRYLRRRLQRVAAAAWCPGKSGSDTTLMKCY